MEEGKPWIDCGDEGSFIGMGLTDIQQVSRLVHGQFGRMKKLCLHGNKLSNVRGIEKMDWLVELDLSANWLYDVSDLTRMRNLRALELSSNRIQSVVGLGNMVQLEELHLAHNLVTELEGIDVGSLKTTLQVLDLRNNRLRSREELVHLRNFQRLRTLRIKEDGSSGGNNVGIEQSLASFMSRMLPSLIYLDGKVLEGQLSTTLEAIGAGDYHKRCSTTAKDCNDSSSYPLIGSHRVKSMGEGAFHTEREKHEVGCQATEARTATDSPHQQVANSMTTGFNKLEYPIELVEAPCPSNKTVNFERKNQSVVSNVCRQHPESVRIKGPRQTRPHVSSSMENSTSEILKACSLNQIEMEKLNMKMKGLEDEIMKERRNRVRAEHCAMSFKKQVIHTRKLLKNATRSADELEINNDRNFPSRKTYKNSMKGTGSHAESMPEANRCTWSAGPSHLWPRRKMRKAKCLLQLLDRKRVCKKNEEWCRQRKGQNRSALPARSTSYKYAVQKAERLHTRCTEDKNSSKNGCVLLRSAPSASTEGTSVSMVAEILTRVEALSSTHVLVERWDNECPTCRKMMKNADEKLSQLHRFLKILHTCHMKEHKKKDQVCHTAGKEIECFRDDKTPTQNPESGLNLQRKSEASCRGICRDEDKERSDYWQLIQELQKRAETAESRALNLSSRLRTLKSRLRQALNYLRVKMQSME